MPKKKIARAVGARFKQARESIRLSQLDVAQELKVAQPTVANWEAGRAMPDLFMLRKLCYVYGLPSDFFLQGLAVIPVDIAHELPTGICGPLDKARNQFQSYLKAFAVPGYDSGLMRL